MALVFRWSETKAKLNLSKHKIGFEEAKTVFNDPFVVTFPDEYHSDDEERYISIGGSTHNRLLVVVYTEHDKPDGTLVIRIISSRKATTLERVTYETESG